MARTGENNRERFLVIEKIGLFPLLPEKIFHTPWRSSSERASFRVQTVL